MSVSKAAGRANSWKLVSLLRNSAAHEPNIGDLCWFVGKETTDPFAQNKRAIP
jgi:hypothetical protein